MNRFSIILPVRNGGEYVKECIASILSQTFRDFNLIVLDSGSIDGTIEWIRRQTDSRIMFYPSNIPLTIEENWSRIKAIPKNEWMTIIGHDDLLHPQYLEVMVALIKKHPTASLYAPHFDFIDGQGRSIGKCRPMPETQSACKFTEKILQNDIDAVGLMIRSKDYESVGGIPLYPNLLFSDFVVWIELAQLSYKATASAYCLSYRLHPTSATKISDEGKYHAAYDQYIQYLSSLKKKSACFNDVINKNVANVLHSRCLEFSKRLLKIGKKDRKNFRSISALVAKHNSYADLLIDNNSLNLSAIPQIRIAKLIDRTYISQKIFLSLSNMLKC